MSKITVTRTYEVEVAQEELDNVLAFNGSIEEIVIAASRCHDVGNMRGTIAMYVEDGQFEYADEESVDRDLVATLVDYRVTEINVTTSLR